MTADLKVLPTPIDERKKSAVELLKDMLAMAERGEVESVVVVAFLDSEILIRQSSSVGITQKIGALQRAIIDLHGG